MSVRGSLLSTGVKYCSPTCNFFRCGQKAMKFRRGSVFCNWTGDACSGYSCSYAICVKRRLLPKGVCGFSVKRKTSDEDLEKETTLNIKIKGKGLEKIGDEFL